MTSMRQLALHLMPLHLPLDNRHWWFKGFFKCKPIWFWEIGVKEDTTNWNAFPIILESFSSQAMLNQGKGKVSFAEKWTRYCNAQYGCRIQSSASVKRDNHFLMHFSSDQMGFQLECAWMDISWRKLKNINFSLICSKDNI